MRDAFGQSCRDRTAKIEANPHGKVLQQSNSIFFRMEEFEVFVVHEEINLKECRNSNLHAGRAAGLVKHACGDRASGLARRKP